METLGNYNKATTCDSSFELRETKTLKKFACACYLIAVFPFRILFCGATTFFSVALFLLTQFYDPIKRDETIRQGFYDCLQFVFFHFRLDLFFRGAHVNHLRHAAKRSHLSTLAPI